MGWHLEKVFQAAARAGWCDSELARRMGVSHSCVSRVRHGRSTPTLKFREGLKRAFPDYDVDRLMWFEARPEEVETTACAG